MINEDLTRISNVFTHICKATWDNDSDEINIFKNLLWSLDNLTLYEVISKKSCRNIFKGFDEKEVNDDTIIAYPKLIPLLSILEKILIDNKDVVKWLNEYKDIVIKNTDEKITSVYEPCEDKVKSVMLTFLYLNKKTIYGKLFIMPIN